MSKSGEGSLKRQTKGQIYSYLLDLDRIKAMHRQRCEQNEWLMRQKDIDTLMRNTYGFTSSQIRDYEKLCAKIRAKYPDLLD
ncbi:hypothetical protein M5689_010849 [Euphorbia peplus]|nr:hypothetical protein M5689_010849 [Euphorbia peplus]